MTDEHRQKAIVNAYGVLEVCDSILHDAKAFSKALVDKSRLVKKESLERIYKLQNGNV